MNFLETVSFKGFVDLAIYLVALAIAWANLKNTSDENRRRIEKLEQEITGFRTTISAIRESLGVIQNNVEWIRKKQGGGPHHSDD